MSSRLLALAFSLALVGCSDADDTPLGSGDVLCSVIDADALGGGGVLPAGCYFLDDDLRITGDVVLEDGVTLLAASQVAIEVESTGSLAANGATAGVALLGQQDAPAFWKGLHFDDAGSTFNQLSRTTIDGACYDAWTGDRSAALFVSDDTRLAVHGLTIRGCPTVGLLIETESMVTLTDLDITGASTPARMSTEAAGAMSGTVTLDVGASISLHEGRVDHATSLMGLPYVMEEDLLLHATLTLDPGTHLRFPQDARLEVKIDGALDARGTFDLPIVFEGEEPALGFWRGIRFDGSTSPSNLLDHVEIYDAGSDSWFSDEDTRAAVMTNDDEVHLRLTNTLIADNAGHPISIDADSAPHIHVASSIFQGNERGPGGRAGAIGLFGPDLQIADNGINAVHVFGTISTSAVSEDAVWGITSVPYIVADEVRVEAMLDILPGATLLFEDDTGIAVRNQGSLVIGGEGPMVELRGTVATPGFWRGVRFDDTFADNAIHGTVMLHAGAGWNSSTESEASVYLDGHSRVSLSHLTVSQSTQHDVFAADDSEVLDCANLGAIVDGDDTAVFCGGL